MISYLITTNIPNSPLEKAFMRVMKDHTQMKVLCENSPVKKEGLLNLFTDRTVKIYSILKELTGDEDKALKYVIQILTLKEEIDDKARNKFKNGEPFSIFVNLKELTE
jgi:hypothetical protein